MDPPDLGLWPTTRGLARLWREQGQLVLVGLACALVYSTLSLAIPIVVQRAIDHSIAPTNGHRDSLWPYLGAIVVLAAIRFPINFTRRYATSRTGIRVEWRMRELLYQAYLRYPRAFYDVHATGQVVSRATNDLYPVRYFIGWGMTQGIQSLMMICGIAIVLFVVNAKLAAIALIAMPLVAILTYNFGRRVMPISREVQQLKADVTEAADESVVGIEMVQAFGREDDVQARFNFKASRVRDGVVRQARIEGLFLPGLLFLPSLSIAAIVYFGGTDVINGHLTNGQFYLFYQLLLQLVWPLEALGWILSLGQRATASASRTFAWLQGIETIPEAAEPAALPDGPLGVTFENVHFSYPQGSEVLTGVDLEITPGEVVAVCGSDRRRQDVATQPAAALLRPGRGPRAPRRRGRQHRPGRGPAYRRRDRHSEADPVLDPAARQPHRRASRTRRGKKWSPRAKRPASPTSLRTSRTATTR